MKNVRYIFFAKNSALEYLDENRNLYLLKIKALTFLFVVSKKKKSGKILKEFTISFLSISVIIYSHKFFVFRSSTNILLTGFRINFPYIFPQRKKR